MIYTRYRRVLPRDLFNEANLLKCLGKLWLILESERFSDVCFREESVDRFEVGQDDDDGSISVQTVTLMVRGVPRRLWRPLNSREPWPLMVRNIFEDYPVFTNYGNLSDEARAFFTGGPE